MARLATGPPAFYASPRLGERPLLPAESSRGNATEAACSLVALLQAVGWTVVAHIHPGRLASQRVACSAGLSPTADVRDGEIRWVSTPAAAP